MSPSLAGIREVVPGVPVGEDKAGARVAVEVSLQLDQVDLHDLSGSLVLASEEVLPVAKDDRLGEQEVDNGVQPLGLDIGAVHSQ